MNDQPNSDSAPPPLPSENSPDPGRQPSGLRSFLAYLLSLGLGLFLADAVISLVDDSLILVFNLHLLTAIRGLVFFFAMLMAVVIYGLMGLTPMIPKRWFLPVTLFNPLIALVSLPFLIFFYSRLWLVSWVFSLGQVVFGLWMFHRILGGFKFRWPLVAEEDIGGRRFSWLNLSGFTLINVFVVLPALLVCLFYCASLGLAHFSEGFLALRPGGLTVQVRDYVRDDGKTIQLIPMSHIAESDFYRKVAQSFPSNAVILMEGVTDRQNLLTNKITYQRAAASLGLTEQAEEFEPTRGELVPADVDIAQFTTDTIGFLNMVMLLHANGVDAGTVLKLVQYSPPPQFETQIFDDLLGKRNRHLLEHIQSRLEGSEIIIVPWGVAHMPELAREIQKSGFRLGETREYTVIRFHGRDPKAPPKE